MLLWSPPHRFARQRTTSSPPRARDELLATGPGIIERLTGHVAAEASTQLDHWLRAARGNADLVLEVLRAADLRAPPDPLAWIYRTLAERRETLRLLDVYRGAAHSGDAFARQRVDALMRNLAQLHLPREARGPA